MKTRIISAIVMLLVVIPLVYFGDIPFALAIGIVSIFGYLEIMKLYNYPLIIKLIGFVSFINLIYSNFDPNMIGFGLSYKSLSISLLLPIIPIIFYQVTGKYTTSDALKLIGFILLVGLGLNFFILIRGKSLEYAIYMFLTPIITDTFAYFGGTLIGKHKVSKLSPKKSWEGCIIGSLMGTIIMGLFYINVINPMANILLVFAITLILTIAGQIGDLFFSAVKRNHNIKDFSNIIPGHGGILDRLDSVIFVAITFMIFIEYI